MGQRIDQFCEDVRLKLLNIDSGLNGLKSKLNNNAEFAERTVREHLDQVRRRMELGRAKVAGAHVEMKNWAEQRTMTTRDKIEKWKTKRDTIKLRNRADNAERYAAAAADVAVAALDEAEEAALEAWLARQDVIWAQQKNASEPIRWRK